MKRKRIDNRFIWTEHRDVTNNKILPLLNIKELINVCCVCKHWKIYIIEYMKRTFRSNIHVPYIMRRKQMLFHFMGVGGRSWVPFNDRYIITNTRATFQLCGLKPNVLLFYGIDRKNQPRMIPLNTFVQFTVYLKGVLLEWRKQGKTGNTFLFIEATNGDLNHCIKIPVTIPAVHKGYYLARKNNGSII